MKLQHRILIGLLASCLVSATAVAVPPRFTGAGDLLIRPPSESTEPTSATPTSTDLGNTNATPVADSDASTSGAQTAPVSEPTKGSNQKTATTDEKKSGSWLANLFRKRDSSVPEHKTQKDVAALVNTEEHHEEIYELLRQADLHRYEPGFDQNWHVQASNIMCSLTQEVPNYGRVEFREGVGQPLEFALYVAHPPAGSGKVYVRSEPARWQHYVRDKDLGTLELEQGDRAVTASTQWSRRLLLELSEGKQPVLSYWDPADGSEDMEILLSAIRFREGLELFHICLGQLLRYDFKKVQLKVVHFHPDSSKLRKQTIEQLDEIVDTAKMDKGITQVNLEIYTQRDGLERYNFRLASRRAQAVRDYLLKHGINEDMIFIKIHTKNKAQMAELGYKDSDVHIALQRDKAK